MSLFTKPIQLMRARLMMSTPIRGFQVIPSLYAKPTLAAEIEYPLKIRSRDLMCERIHEKLPNVDWAQIKRDWRPIHQMSSQALEIRIMTCLMSMDDGHPHKIQGCASYLNFLQQLDQDFGQENVYYKLHLASLMGDTDPIKYGQQIKQIVQNSINENPKSFRFPITHKAIAAMSASSRENCLMAVKLLFEGKDQRAQFTQKVLESCLKFGLHQEYLEILNVHPNIQPSPELLVKSLFEYKTSDEDHYQLLLHAQDNSILFSSPERTAMKKILTRLNYTLSDCAIKENGTCGQCGYALKTIGKEETDILRQEVYKKVLDQNDIFLASSPQEVKSFFKFLQENAKDKPYDLIVDGMNMGYINSPRFVKEKMARGRWSFWGRLQTVFIHYPQVLQLRITDYCTECSLEGL